MVVKEMVKINEKSFNHYYSDEGKILEGNGKYYSDVVDSLDSNIQYVETQDSAPITLTLSMIKNSSMSKDKEVYEIRADVHGNLSIDTLYS